MIVGHFVAKEKPSFQMSFHLLSHVIDIIDQILDCERFFEDVSLVRATGQGGHRRQISTIAPHRFDHEDTSFRSLSRLFDFVTDLFDRSISRRTTTVMVIIAYLDDFIQCRISTNAEFGPRNVVRNCCWDTDQGDFELGMLIARLIHLQNRRERLRIGEHRR